MIRWIFDIGFGADDENRVPGWTVPMGSMLLVTVAFVVSIEFGLRPGWPVTILAVVDTLIAASFVRIRTIRIWKRGPFGFLRGGSWIDIAAACWVIWASAYCYSGITFLRKFPLAVWQQWLLDASHFLIPRLPPIGIGCTLAGIFLGLLRRRPARGPAMHVVAFFFWGAAIIFGAMAIVPQNAAWPMLVGEIAAIFGVAVFLAAAVLAVMQKRSSERSDREE